MQRKVTGWKTKGMNRDLSVSAFNAEFAFENVNLRVSTNDDNTLMSWVNEKGPASISVSIDVDPWIPEGASGKQQKSTVIQGSPIGTAVINHQLVLFTIGSQHPVGGKKYDSIYVFWYSNPSKTAMDGKLLFEGPLNFDGNYPLETLTSYEAEYIQKVYWTDGYNQPRLINIAASNETLKKWHDDIDIGGVFSNTTSSVFDFVPAIHRTEETEVKQYLSSSGTFAPGVIQYCFTYINKYGQQSNIVDVTPLYYLAYADRGASPEERVTCSFDIVVSKLDTNFDKVRLYSIQRTSLDTDPIVKLLSDIEPVEYTENATTYYKVSYTDNGTQGSIIDPYELLYAGGKEITALTMKDKDNTLFLGNLKEIKASVKNISDWIEDHPITVSFAYDDNKKLILDSPNGSYPYTPEWDNHNNTHNEGKSQEDITTFKGGEYYRFGFQLQKKTGEWSEPIFIKDAMNPLYPKYDHTIESGVITSRYVQLISALCTLDFSSGTPFDDSFWDTYVRVRPVIVYPNVQDRTVVCQGVLNPTVFNVEDRADNSPYSQASWFFRPYTYLTSTTQETTTQESILSFNHYSSVNGSIAYNQETQGGVPVVQDSSTPPKETPYGSYNPSFYDSNKFLSNNQFFVDQSIVTFNSPELEFDTNSFYAALQNLKLRIIGMIPITANWSSYSLETSTAMLSLGHWDTNDNWQPEEDPIKGLPWFIPEKTTFGIGDRGIKIQHENLSVEACKRLCSAYLWNDAFVYKDVKGNGKEKDGTNTSYLSFNWLIYPWHRQGSLNNDSRNSEEASSYIKTKKEATLSYSYVTEYISNLQWNSGDSMYEEEGEAVDFGDVITKICLTENAEVINYRLDEQKPGEGNINYYPNIDKLLYTLTGYTAIYEGQTHTGTGAATTFEEDTAKNDILYTPINMKYKSTSHAVVAFKSSRDGSSDIVPILPYADDGTHSEIGKWGNTYTGHTYWQSSSDEMVFTQDKITISDLKFKDYPFLWLGELYKDVTNRFGSGTDDPMKNTWLIAGPDVAFGEDPSDVPTYRKATLKWAWGDTFFQRYDCLKTYAFSDMDKNQIVEILSFMCETHVNLDGRYDKQRGQLKNFNMNPTVFNLLNSVYSQQNNFFAYKKLDIDQQDTQEYPNQITFTKNKTSGEDVDLWTNITLASTLEMDGDKGQVTSLQRFNDALIAFQDSGISQILYNENVQIAAQNGVPIEIANSGKVQGKRYISDTVGCSNKWSVVQTPQGIYFMDSNNKGMYVFNGQLNNLSSAGGMNSWSKLNIPSSDVLWTPGIFNNFVSYYDKQNNDTMFINKDISLHYSERVGAFTSFYNYGRSPYFNNLDDTGVWTREGNTVQTLDKTFLYKHQAGDYGNFFGTNYPYSMTLVGNPEPQLDKIFTNLEFRACVNTVGNNPDSEGTVSGTVFTPLLPFNTLETWDEYQHGIASLSNSLSSTAMLHHDVSNAASLKRKFRIWRCDVPRDNADVNASSENPRGIFRIAKRPLDRMRNPWIYLKLQKEAAASGSSLPRAEIHDIMMSYWT